ncbi:DNA topoisomerase I, mitochondrial isoform X1 [Anguilla rostrata]|uniref:DNA topoisomerase I, mitochondrial isoform X1 n=2 Tax=Anguilla rostrata TaxID=7938 RepID=UPI0030D3C1EB
MEEKSCAVGRDSKLLGGNPSRKRTSDSKHRTSSDRTRIKDATEKKHKSNRREKGGKHSGLAVVVSTQVRGTHSDSHCKPLQESKITSSEKLACHVTAESGNSEGDVGTEVFDSSMDAHPSACRNYTDINNNIFAVSEELEGKRSIDSAVRQNMTSERSAPTKKTIHTEVSKMKKDKKKHKFKCSKEWTCEMGKNSGKPMEKTKDTLLTKSRSKSESQPEKDKSHKSKSKKKETKSKDAIDAVKEEMDECSVQDYGELREDTQAEIKTLKKAQSNWQNIKGESHKEKVDIANPMKKRKNDKGRSVKMGTEDEKTLRKGQEEGKSSHKNKRKKDTADADEPKKKKGKIGKQSMVQKSAVAKKDEARLWKWWEEGQSLDGQKWKTLEHKGPLFPPEYESLPPNVSFYYNGKPVRLSVAAEEVATFYAKMLDHEYTTKETFQKNFFTDWRMEMTRDECDMIKDLSKCDFREIHKYFVDKAEEKKALSKEEKKALKEEANKQTEEYGYCLLDGHREKIGNFRVEPPGLFRGRGEHPKMGKLKRRVMPEDITINCSKESNIPVPPKGHRWKKVQHDNTVTWLASWVENIQGSIKYIMLNPSSKLKGEKDWQKYEIARKLKLKVAMIRRQYQSDWKSREMKKRQRGVAVYFIDKLALRAGNEKEEGESADTVGCCSLRVEHITLHEELDGQTWVVEFDFLGKDSIRYYNKVPVEKRVFKNLKLFMENKSPEDDLFDRINTVYLNKTLNESMTGLSAKVFRTFNASTTLQEQLNKLTHVDMSVDEKILSYNRANRAVAILCNHQRAAPKTFEKSMQLLQEKIAQKRKQLDEAKEELKQVQTQDSDCSTDKSRKMVENKEKAVKRLKEQLKKLLLQMTDREENKVIALGTSKLNYLDPRISVAWCKKFDVPVEKIYNKTQRDKFAWAIDMTEEDYQF